MASSRRWKDASVDFLRLVDGIREGHPAHGVGLQGDIVNGLQGLADLLGLAVPAYGNGYDLHDDQRTEKYQDKEEDPAEILVSQDISVLVTDDILDPPEAAVTCKCAGIMDVEFSDGTELRIQHPDEEEKEGDQQIKADEHGELGMKALML